jgi:hypothetical protein
MNIMSVRKLALAAVAVTAITAADHQGRGGTTFFGVICEKFCDPVYDAYRLWDAERKGETAEVRAPTMPGKPPHCGRTPDGDTACCKVALKRLFIVHIPQLGSKSPWRTICH